MYGFNSGHFFSNIASRNIPFEVVLAADTRPSGRALMEIFLKCPTVLVSSDDILQTTKAFTIASTVLHGYFIHSHRFLQSSTRPKFWKTQASIIKALQCQQGLVVFTATIHPEWDLTPVTAFKNSLKHGGWILSDHNIYYPNFGDSIADSAMFIMGVQRTCSQYNIPIICPIPPAVSGRNLWEFA